VGARTDEIVVEEGITHVETISPTLGMSVTSLQIQNMPLNGRNTLDLALLQPGVIRPRRVGVRERLALQVAVRIR